jgi:hypothetical protein
MGGEKHIPRIVAGRTYYYSLDESFAKIYITQNAYHQAPGLSRCCDCHPSFRTAVDMAPFFAHG